MKRPVPGFSVEQQPADTVLVMLAYGEARNQSALGILGPVMVALNRAYPGQDIPSSYAAGRDELKIVILKPWQFSCFNQNDPNRAKLLDAWQDDPYAWGRCWAVTELALAGACDDPTHGGSHYCTRALWNQPGNKWFEAEEIESGRTVKTAEIGDHVFARAP